RLREADVGAGERRVELEGAAVGGDGGVAGLRFAQVEPGQDEVGAAFDGLLERGDRLVALRDETQVELHLDELRVELDGVADQRGRVVAAAQPRARGAGPLRGQGVCGRAGQDGLRSLFAVS